MTRGTILVTGATGYIGGRLVPRLLEAGYRVRCMVRSPKKLQARSWAGHPEVDIVAGDLDDLGSAERALSSCEAASSWCTRCSPPDLTTPSTIVSWRVTSPRPRCNAFDEADRLPRRLGRNRSRPERAPVVTPRGRAGACQRHSAGDHAAGGHDHRLRLGLLRNPPLSGRAAASDGDSALGAHGITADRRFQRPRVPGERPEPASIKGLR